MARTLAGRRIIITGASSGIGAATARCCGRAGMKIVLAARRENRLEEVAEAVTRAGGEAEVVVCDVAEPGSSGRILDACERRFGGIDVVFANAGYGFRKPTIEVTSEEWRRLFDVNFFAGLELLVEAARRLIAQNRAGHLLMCSSVLAKFTMRCYGAYSATKAAQNHVCRALRMEHREAGVEVSSVHPVTTATEFFRTAAAYLGEHDEDGFGGTPRWMVQPPERVARAVVRCLERPRPEVWTSLAARVVAGLVTIFPHLMDTVGGRA